MSLQLVCFKINWVKIIQNAEGPVCGDKHGRLVVPPWDFVGRLDN